MLHAICAFRTQPSFACSPGLPARTIDCLQTVRWSHWLLSHAASWQRDDQRLSDLMPRVGTLPLGSGEWGGRLPPKQFLTPTRFKSFALKWAESCFQRFLLLVPYIQPPALLLLPAGALAGNPKTT